MAQGDSSQTAHAARESRSRCSAPAQPPWPQVLPISAPRRNPSAPAQGPISGPAKPHFHPSRRGITFPVNSAYLPLTFHATPHNSAIAYRAVLLKEALIKSARVDGERFSVKSRFEKCRNTLCISSFSNRWIGGKYPPSTADDLFRVSSNMISQKAADANINLDAASAIFAASPHRRRAVRERHSLTCGERRSASAALRPLRGSPCPAARGGRCPYRAAGRRRLPSAPLRAHRS